MADKEHIREQIADALRDGQKATALTLKINGATFEAIGKTLGIKSVTARELVKEALREYGEENAARVAEKRAEAEIRFNKVLLGLAPQVSKGHIGASREFRQTVAEICKLHGLYAPERHEHSGPGGRPIAALTIDPEKLSDEQLQVLIERLSGAGAGVGPGSPQALPGAGTPPPGEGGPGAPQEG